MIRDSILPERRFRASRLRTPSYPDKLLPHIQDMLATLADIETRYEVERERLQMQGDSDLARHRAAEIEKRYRRERDSCVRQLAALHEKLKATMGSDNIRPIW